MERQMALDDLHVMLVEPSHTQYKVIADQLNGCGVSKIDHYHAGNEVLAAMQHNLPDLVISTMYLPDMTGTDLVEMMRQRVGFLDVAFMLISSETSMRYLDPIRQAGAIAILPKPFNPEQLQKALYTTLDFLEPQQLELDDRFVEELNVLVVDDSRTARAHIKRTLNGIGIEKVSVAENGKQAIALIEDDYFDLVVTDYNMPEMDGRQLVDFIRKESKQAGIPILMVTSESDESHIAGVEQAGVSALCGKPFDIDTVRNLIRKIMI